MIDKLPDHAALVKLATKAQNLTFMLGFADDNEPNATKAAQNGMFGAAPWAALLAVLETHKPESISDKSYCAELCSVWPCDTYVALATPFIGLVP